MNIKGQITFLINQDNTELTIRDEASGQIVCEVILTPEELSMSLSRLSHTPCKIKVYPEKFNKIGKILETDSFTFVLPPELVDSRRDKKVLSEYATTVAPNGWEVDDYFGSQSSFFTNENGKQSARCIIRRWV